MKKNTKATRIKKVTRKTATKIKQKKKPQKYSDEKIYFEVILMIVLIPSIVFFTITVFQKPVSEKLREPARKVIYKNSNQYSVEVATGKSVYKLDEEMTLAIKNNSDDLIYFEPCGYLNNFEKQINGIWKSGEGIIENKIYDSYNFKSKKRMTNCVVYLPKSGVGTYRTVVKVYYDCEMPGGDMCSDSKVFYSNEFRVVGAK